MIIEQLEKTEFSPAEQNVVDYLLKFPEKIETSTIQELAKATYTQPSTFIRIAKKLNYSGFKAFRKSYLEEWHYLHNNFSKIDANLPFTKEDSLMNITKKIAILEKSTIEDVQSLLQHDKLTAAKQLLLKADTIIIFARNENLLLSKTFAIKMNRIGKKVYVSVLKGEEGFEIHNLPANSCAIIISYSGEHHALIRIRDLLNQFKIPILIITSLGEHSLTKNCDCFLPITTREKLYSKIANFTINTSVNYILDVLYALVFSENYEKNLAHLKYISSLIDPRKSSLNIIKEE